LHSPPAMAPGINTMRRNAQKAAFIALLIAVISGPAHGQTPAAEAELARILAELRGAIESFERPPEIAPGWPNLEDSMRKLSAVAAGLDLFELTFGVRRETVEGWPAIQAAAKQALRPSQAEDGERYYTIDASNMDRAILQELAGDLEGALVSLARIKPGGMCGNWIATVELAVNMRRSAILERMGREQEALAAHESAVRDSALALDSQNFPVLSVRYGILLEKSDRVTEAWAQYQRVVDLFPGTNAERIARAKLRAVDKLVAPTAARVGLYLKGDDRRQAILALAVHRFPESAEMLLGLLANLVVKATVIEALGRLGDPRAAPPLRALLESDPPDWIPLLLLALHRIGDDSKILPALERVRHGFGSFGSGSRLRNLQELLIEIAPAGPTFSETEVFPSPRRFADAWIAHLEKTAAASKPTTSRPATR
jgi:tetratricopeptide (TPR) repeat protein